MVAVGDTVAQLESELEKVPGILSARVIVDDGGDVREVHVVAGPYKAPKQVARDVATLSVARFGLELDHRLVSVVQIDDQAAARAAAPPAQRAQDEQSSVLLEAVTGTHRAGRYKVEVVTSRLGRRSVGTATARDSAGARLTAAARAALDSVSSLAGLEDAEVDGASVLSQGGKQVVIVTIFGSGRSAQDEMLGAVAVGESGPEVAAAEAVVDACNRRPPRVEPLESGAAKEHTW